MAYGDITYADQLQWTTSSANNGVLVKVTDGIVAVFWSATGSDGYVRTYPVDADGNIGAMIDSWEWEPSQGVGSFFADWVTKVSDNIYAIWYCDPSNKMYVKTITISNNGSITKTPIATQYIATPTTPYYVGGIIKKPGTTTYLAWYVRHTTSAWCYLYTVNIDDDGTNISVLDSWITGAYSPNYPMFAHVTGDVFLGTHCMGASGQQLFTFQVADNGTIDGTLLDTEYYSASTSYAHQPVEVTDNVFAVFAGGTNNVYTFSVTDAGEIATIDSGTYFSKSLAFMRVGNFGRDGADFYFAVIGQNAWDGFLATISIDADGVVGGAIDNDEFISNVCQYCYNFVEIQTGVYVMAWATTPGVQGYLTTLLVETPSMDATLILEQALSVAGERQPINTVSPVWTDMTEYLMSIDIKRGRQHELNRVDAGVATFVLNNETGNFWRNNAAGAFYPDIQPLTLTRLRKRYQGVYYPVYYGMTEKYKPGWREKQGGFTPIMTLSCVDIFKSFTRAKAVDANPAITEDANSGQKVVHVNSTYGLIIGQSIKIYDNDNAEVNYVASIDYDNLTVTMVYNLSYDYDKDHDAYLKKFPAGLSGQRIRDLLLEAQWPAALTSIDDGQVIITELSPAAGGVAILDELYKTVEAEDGNLFTAADGIVTYHDSIARTKNPYNTSQATFKDDDNDSKYVLPELLDDDTYIYNEASITGPNIGTQGMYDPDAQVDQGPRVLSRKDSKIYYGHDAAAQAFVLVERFKASKMRCQALHVYPKANISDLLPKVLGYDLVTRITLQLNSARNPAGLDSEYHIEGIEHSWNPFDDLWKTKWQLWDINQYQSFDTLHDGYVYNRSLISYADCQGASEAYYSPFNDTGKIMVGQRRTSEPAWDIIRGLVEIDTTELPASANILEAYLLVYFEEIYVPYTWSLVLVNNGGVANPLEEADYGVLGTCGLPSRGTNSCAVPAGWRVIPLTATGISEINKEGITRFGIRNSNDIGSVEPTLDDSVTNEFVYISGVGSLVAPKLVVRLL